MGLVCGTVYLLCMFVFIYFAFSAHLDEKGSDETIKKLTELVAALLTITCMLFLGFADDVLVRTVTDVRNFTI